MGISYTDSISLIMLMNGIGACGRLLPNIIADKITGPLNLMLPLTFSTALVTYCWATVSTRGGVWIFAAAYGLIASGLQGLFPAVLSSLTTDLSKQGVRMGMGFTFVGIASATGPPLAGALIQAHGGGYLYAQMWAASSIFAGGCVLVMARWARVGWTMKKV
jgi:MFS family permease